MTDPLPMLPDAAKYDYQGQCWWCGGVADSREHKFMRAEVVRLFGPGPYGKGLVRVEGDQQRFIQGPNSGELKFPTNLCAPCNNARSQPFDEAYNRFSTYSLNPQNGLENRRIVRLDQVYGGDWRAEGQRLVAYYLKHIGCRLARDGVKVPKGIVDFMDAPGSVIADVDLEFGFRQDLYEMVRHGLQVHGEDSRGLWMTPSICMYSKSRNEVTDVEGAVTVGCNQLSYYVCIGQPARRHPFSRKRLKYSSVWIVAPEEAKRSCQDCFPPGQ